MGRLSTLGLYLLFLSACQPGGPPPARAVIAPQWGEFLHEIVTQGELEPVVQETLTVPERMWGTLESLLPEGQLVQPGEVVARINSRHFIERMNRYTERSAEERANLMKQRAELPLEQLRIQASIEEKKRLTRLQQLEQLLVREGPRLDERVRVQVEEEIAALQAAFYPLNEKENLYQRGYLSEQELLSARQEVLSLETRRQQAALTRQQQSADYRQPEIQAATLKSKSAQLEKKIAELDGQARQALLRTQSRNQSSRVKGYERRFNNLQARIGGAELRAPFAGTILYPRLAGDQPPRIGMEVWNGMPVAQVVKTDSLCLRTRVDEFRIPHLQVGQKVRLSSPGLPGESVSGTVSKIQKLAKYRDERHPSGLKYFEVEIQLSRLPAGLRAHMHLEARIEVQRLSQVWTVPLEALEEQGSKTFLRLQEGGKIRLQAVEVLARSEDQAALKGNWTGREQILLGGTP